MIDNNLFRIELATDGILGFILAANVATLLSFDGFGVRAFATFDKDIPLALKIGLISVSLLFIFIVFLTSAMMGVKMKRSEKDSATQFAS